MYIALTQLEQEEVRVEHQYDRRFELSDASLQLISAPVIQLRLGRVSGKEIRVQGRLRTEVRMSCDRCLDSFDFPVDVTLDLFYAPIGVLTPEEDVPLTPKDLAYAFYRDELIDVDALVREQILLALPFRRLCQPDCRGLCSSCGADLNYEQCACEQESAAPYWSALLGLKKSIQ